MSVTEQANKAAAERFPYSVTQISQSDLLKIIEMRRVYAEGWVSRPTGMYTETIEKILQKLEGLEAASKPGEAKITWGEAYKLLVEFAKTFLPNADKHIPGLVELQATMFMDSQSLFEMPVPRMYTKGELKAHISRVLQKITWLSDEARKHVISGYFLENNLL